MSTCDEATRIGRDGQRQWKVHEKGCVCGCQGEAVEGPGKAAEGQGKAVKGSGRSRERQ